MQIAVVATARKLTVLCWHLVVKEQDYAFARPSLTAKKQRALELRAGLPPRRGHKGSAAAYSLKEIRRRENEVTTQAEAAYRQMIAGWQPRPRPEVAARPDPAGDWPRPAAGPQAQPSAGARVGAAAVTGARLSGAPPRATAARQG
jgi:transposase